MVRSAALRRMRPGLLSALHFRIIARCGRNRVVELNKLQDMVLWLESIGIDVSQWGTSTSKSLENLWDEYLRGEIYFVADPPLRIVQVVQIIVGRNDMILLEMEQEFSNSKRRSRNQPPSEKIKPGEDLYDAALRCLNEELGLEPVQIDIDKFSYTAKEEIIESPSYPGLLTRYTIHTLEVQVTGLPEQEFWRENVAAGEGDPVKRHLWGWAERP